MKYKITEDVLELDDNLSEEEIDQELWEYVNDFLDWGYTEVEE